MIEHILVSLLASSRASHPTWQCTYSSLRLLAARQTSQRERAHSLFFTDYSSLTLSHIFRAVRKAPWGEHIQSMDHWCQGNHSFIIHPSKPTDPRRNKLDIFNSCFDFSILIPVLTTAFQLLLGLRRLNSGSIIYNRCGGARGVMVIVTGYGDGDTSSIPGQDWLHFT